MTQIVSVRVLDAPYHIDRPFDYVLPAHIETAPRGSLVRIPFGGGNRPTWGVVMGEGTFDATVKYKPVLSMLDARFALNEEMLGLCLFLSDYYLCSLGDAVRACLPPALFASSGHNIRLKHLLSLKTEADVSSVLPTLRSATHRTVLFYLQQHGETERDALCEATGANHTQIKALLDKGLVALRYEEDIRNPYATNSPPDTTPILLSRAQNSAYERLSALYDTKKARAALLHGVTGSGKTKIMLKLIDRVIADGKSAIVMVPEIALTPQTVHIFSSRYGERVAVIHSSLSAGERFDAWRRIAGGHVDLVIGTRSAVFAPLPNLGLMIIDEEHEHTYQSEQNPKYLTHNVCAYRAGVKNALLVLASATPSFETYYKARAGQYELIELTERYGGARLPKAEVVDMRQEMRNGNLSPLSHKLHDALTEVGEREEQAILFLNRRGYNASLQCKNCGTVITCPHCSVALTYHASPAPHLLCHLCGFQSPVPRACPECHDTHISYVGFGTQKAEGEIANLLPHMRVLRMDADTTGQKQAYDHMLDAFRRGDADILLGTQMVTKGHDFPHVSLVGVVLADMGMYVNDFRASERTFSLLTQVIGRAGRADTPGRAIIQTFSPRNDVIRLAEAQDYKTFYESEIELRREMCFPPFCDMVHLTLTSENEQRLSDAIKTCAARAVALANSDFRDTPIQMFGPMEAPVYRVAEQYRMRLMFKCRWNARTRNLFRTLLTEGMKLRGITVGIELNPRHA